MKLVTTTNRPEERFGTKEAIRLIKEAGFDGYDASMFSMVRKDDECGYNTDGYRQYAESLRSYADSIGLECLQAHAPFPSTRPDDDEYNEMAYSQIVRSIEIASILGAPIIIVHPVQHLDYRIYKEELFNMSMDFYKSLIPYAEKFNVKIAVENMFQTSTVRNNTIVDSTCAHKDEFIRYIDSLNSPYITACLDIGHTNVVSDNPSNMIEALGDRIGCFHIHDNNGIRDLHTLPFLGNLDWHEITKSIAKIGYSGHFTYEADSFMYRMDNELIPTALKFMEQVGRHLIGLIEKYKKEI